MGDSLELMGKRLFLLLSEGRSDSHGADGAEPQKAGPRRDWLRGTVRAVSVIGLAAPEAGGGEAAAGLTVFVEFQNAVQQCSWVQVYGEGVKALLVEESIVWAPQSDGTGSAAASANSSVWPALTFRSLVDRVGLGSVVPVEFFGKGSFEFLPEDKSLQKFEFDKDLRHSCVLEHPALLASISSWRSDFELQEIFRKGSYTIQGRRVRVYQPEFEERWAIGLVSQHDPLTHIMEITMDEGDENQMVDPRVIHVMLTEDELGKNARRRKESEAAKVDSGRRRRSASDGEDEKNLKRFKGAGEAASTDGEAGQASAAGPGLWTGEGGAAAADSVSSTTKNGSSRSPDDVPALLVEQAHAARSSGQVKENGRPLSTQGVPDSTTPLPHTPTPPPLKPAPSLFSNTSFPSLGQMPSLVPGGSVHKASAAPLAEPAYPRTAALVSPGPVTIASSSQGSGASVTLSPAVAFSPKAPAWGNQTEGSKTHLGFRSPASLPGAAPVFGEVSSQTNGAPGATGPQDPSRPFGFGFGGDKKKDAQPPQDQNLFFQCMTQSPGPAPSPAAAQSSPKDTNYFTAVSEGLGKEPPSLFKAADGQKKPAGPHGSVALFGSQKEPPKVPESHAAGNGVLAAAPGGARGAVPAVPAPSSGAHGAGKRVGSNGAAAPGPPPTKTPDGHQNLFLQASQEPPNPFLAYGDAPPAASFAGFSGAEAESVAAASDGKPNLFTMAEQPKGMLASAFAALPSAAAPSSSSPAPAFSQRPQSEGAKPKEEQDSQEKPTSTSGSSPGGNGEAPGHFEQSQTQKFNLEDRGQSSKRDSDSSINSDLSDLSENEEGPDRGPGPGRPPGPAKEAGMLPKSKTVGAPKGRPRTKPFKVGQSVLKDQSKVRRLKQSGESFLQDGSCINVAPHLHKCRECRLERYRKYRDEDTDGDDDPNVACRFFHFRRLAFTRKGILRVEGFLSPQQSDAMAMGLWLPAPAVQEGLDLDTSKYILANVGDQFCQLVMSEKEAMMLVEPHQKVAWKRAVRGVREMCDVCETTLFNIHWVCRKCGFGVCLDCYRLRRNRPREDVDEAPEDEVFAWLKCAKGQPHEPQNLMPTQIIPGAALYNIGDMVHSARGKWGIKANCPCTSRHGKTLGRPSGPNGISQHSSSSSLGAASTSGVGHAAKSEADASAVKLEAAQTALTALTSDGGGGETVGGASGPSAASGSQAKEPRAATGEGNSSALHWLADLATQKAKDDTKDSGSLRSMMGRDGRPPFGLDALGARSKPCVSSPKLFNSLLLGGSLSQPKPEGSSLRDLLNSGPGRLPQGPGDGGVPFPSVFTSGGGDKLKGSLPDFLDHIIASVVETKKAEGRRGGPPEGGELGLLGARREGVMGLSVLDPHTSHSWLCDGRLLCLQDPSNGNNWKIFRECWKQGQPVLVSGIHKRLKGNLWQPDAFSKEFGDQDVDLVNCRNCSIISDVKVRDFWDGFQVISRRLKGSDGQPMVLKLKDWPPGEDFRDMMPTRFDDLMDNLPLPEYTKRDGRLNLAARLPNFFVRPDLGPKMYNAYGLISTEDSKVGTTNLHLDVSDAVNVMVYVGIPQEAGDHENEPDIAGRKEVMTTIEEGDVDEKTKRRVYEMKEKPGALWHIYAAKDAEKIRELLRKVGEEQGQENPPDHDPIHDQSWYLDQVLRRRLLEDYGVQGWAIVQFLGDAVFIPAGAPHQVHNLYSCIKVAEDFVSPEHVKHCFRLTQEFRHLSTTHSNHEDKLQVKNIIYHAVKDAVGTLKAHEPQLARP
ncbi:lysine-specific demethylase 3B isoform X1 [Gadus morhua]|uniref:Lysine-specific demethylase n=1 Tax=Gadus morhua TaxID=8049 RepID=A0A8C5AAN2_GADMO|nr:lysine-specific demethylase 3B isoform X1 [Gadus morhua]